MFINFVILSVGMIFFVVFCVLIFRFFINDLVIIVESRKVVFYFFVLFLFFGIFLVVNNMFNSVGYIKKSMVIGMICFWGIRFLFSYGFGVLMRDMVGMWFGMGLSNVFGVVIVFVWFFRGSWMRVIIEKY